MSVCRSFGLYRSLFFCIFSSNHPIILLLFFRSMFSILSDFLCGVFIDPCRSGDDMKLPMQMVSTPGPPSTVISVAPSSAAVLRPPPVYLRRPRYEVLPDGTFQIYRCQPLSYQENQQVNFMDMMSTRLDDQFPGYYWVPTSARKLNSDLLF